MLEFPSREGRIGKLLLILCGSARMLYTYCSSRGVGEVGCIFVKIEKYSQKKLQRGLGYG